MVSKIKWNSKNNGKNRSFIFQRFTTRFLEEIEGLDIDPQGKNISSFDKTGLLMVSDFVSGEPVFDLAVGSGSGKSFSEFSSHRYFTRMVQSMPLESRSSLPFDSCEI